MGDTPFSDFPQISVNTNSIKTLNHNVTILQNTTSTNSTAISNNTADITTNTADINTIDSTAAFLNTITKNNDPLQINNQITANNGNIVTTSAKVIISTGVTGSGMLHFANSNYMNHNRIYGHQSGNFWKQDYFLGGNGQMLTMRLGKNQNATPFMTFNGNMSAQGYSGSDDRIKFNETDISNSLEILNQLKPKKYEKIVSVKEGKDWIPSDASWNEVKNKTDASGHELWNYTEEIGLIAQDIQKIPDLSFCILGEEYDSSGNQTPLSIHYDSIFSLLIQSVKDLKNEVDELKQKIN